MSLQFDYFLNKLPSQAKCYKCYMFCKSLQLESVFVCNIGFKCLFVNIITYLHGKKVLFYES